MPISSWKTPVFGAAMLITGGYAHAQTGPATPSVPDSMQHDVPRDGPSRQEHVHEMGQNVMPFDLNKTTHIFQMMDWGGVQSVVVKDPQDKGQIGLIRQHLRHEADAFKHGDYTDPVALHGKTMLGVSELKKHHSAIDVSYSDLPLGAALTFKTRNRHLATAIHRWFGAQLSEHGADARAE